MIHLDTLSTLVAATLVLLLGRKLVHSVSLLKKYTIPEPVAGGLLVALALLILKKSMGWEIDFDMSLKDPLMLAFFATIGLNANLASLRSGGKVLGVFLIVVVGLLLMQNAIGIVFSVYLIPFSSSFFFRTLHFGHPVEYKVIAIGTSFQPLRSSSSARSVIAE